MLLDLLSDVLLQPLAVLDASLQPLELLLQLVDLLLVFIDNLLFLIDLLFVQFVFLLVNQELEFASLGDSNRCLFKPLLVVLRIHFLG